MKKILIAIILLSASLFLVSCGNDNSSTNTDDPKTVQPEKELETLINNLNDKDANYEMIMETELLGIKLSITTKIDGNKTYSSAFINKGEMYTEVVEDTTYLYTKEESGWTKHVSTAEINIEFDTEEFKPEDFTFADSKFTLKEEKRESYSSSNLVIQVTDECKGGIFTISSVEEGIETVVKFTIKNFGTTKITLPVVAEELPVVAE